jgi:hypothetical protein
MGSDIRVRLWKIPGKSPAVEGREKEKKKKTEMLPPESEIARTSCKFTFTPPPTPYRRIPF